MLSEQFRRSSGLAQDSCSSSAAQRLTWISQKTTGARQMIRTVVTAALVLCSSALCASTYSLEPDYSQGVFRWNHLGFSNPSAQFAQAQGTLEFDAAHATMSSVSVSIPLDSLHTGVPALDDHLRSEDFFETKKYPTATFKSTKVVQGAMSRQLKVSGNLTLHGVTRPVLLDVTLVKAGTNPRTSVPTLGFEAVSTVKRSDFGLGAYVPQVSDDVTIHIVTQAVEAKAHAEYLKAQAAEEAAEKAASKSAK
jgi:polyisoprenoid-binding protein YceI